MSWDPVHFQNGQLLHAAFSSDDLLNVNNRFVSVDREDLICKSAVDHRVKAQREKGDKRDFPKFSYLRCGEFQGVIDPKDNTKLFVVFSDKVKGHPSLPDNPAHCGIRGRDPQKKSKGYKQLLRTKLVNSIQKTIDYSEVDWKN
mgnify:FL=1